MEINEFKPAAPFNCICIATGSITIRTSDTGANWLELFTGNQFVSHYSTTNYHQVHVAYIIGLSQGQKPEFQIACSASKSITVGNADNRYARMEFIFIPVK